MTRAQKQMAVEAKNTLRGQELTDARQTNGDERERTSGTRLSGGRG